MQTATNGGSIIVVVVVVVVMVMVMVMMTHLHGNLREFRVGILIPSLRSFVVCLQLG
jgi:hypothetical protein